MNTKKRKNKQYSKQEKTILNKPKLETRKELKKNIEQNCCTCSYTYYLEVSFASLPLQDESGGSGLMQDEHGASQSFTDAVLHLIRAFSPPRAAPGHGRAIYSTYGGVTGLTSESRHCSCSNWRGSQGCFSIFPRVAFHTTSRCRYV